MNVTGRPDASAPKVSEPEWIDENPKLGSVAYLDKKAEEAVRQAEAAAGKEAVRIMVEIRISNGMQMWLSGTVLVKLKMG